MSHIKPCEICLESMLDIKQITFECGCKGVMHTTPCLEEWIQTQPGKCPICMKPFDYMKPLQQYDVPPVTCNIICGLLYFFCAAAAITIAYS